MSVTIRAYDAEHDHSVIRTVYGRAFGDTPWPTDWDDFDAFDAKGVFVAEDTQDRKMIGYVVSFPHLDFGYISVVAVVQEYQRKGIGCSLVRRAVDYLHCKGLSSVEIDAYQDNPAAVGLYSKFDFSIEETFEDEEE